MKGENKERDGGESIENLTPAKALEKLKELYHLRNTTVKEGGEEIQYSESKDYNSTVGEILRLYGEDPDIKSFVDGKKIAKEFGREFLKQTQIEGLRKDIKVLELQLARKKEVLRNLEREE